MVILNVLKTILNKVTFNGLIFFMFAIFASGLFYKYANNVEKIKMLKSELQVKETSNMELRSKNAELIMRNSELADQFNMQMKRQKDLSEELLLLSEEKSNCYKKIIKYNEKLKNTAIKAPARVERLVNKHYDRVFQDVANTTGTDK